MFSTTDTIVAIATPSGRGAIGVVRLSGPSAHHIARVLSSRSTPFEPRVATVARVHAGALDDGCLITHFPAPASYTGDDVVEISAHGSDVVLRAIVAAACKAGARLAAPGEFTLRAFLNGKLSLTQAEAVGDLIDAVTPLQARVAFDQLNGTLTSSVTAVSDELFDLVARLEASIDFPDEGYHFIDQAQVCASLDALAARIDALLAGASRGRLVREGVQVVLTGLPNAGKSSLFNALVGAHRAIVSDVPGTTRDVLTEVVDFSGLRVTLVDTAGVTDSSDPVEREGVARARKAVSTAHVVVHIVDGSGVDGDASVAGETDGRTLVVASKADLPRAWNRPGVLAVSAKTGAGIEELVSRICSAAGAGEDLSDPPMVSNIRHVQLLERARSALDQASASVREMGRLASEEFVLADLQSARAALEEVTGVRTPDDVLAQVFARFCVGK